MKTELKERYKWLIAIGANVLLLVLTIMLAGLNYETSDDFVISERIVADYPFVGYVNYYLCVVMIKLQDILTGVNIYIAAQVLSSCLAFILITKLFLDHASDKVFYVIYGAVLVFYTVDHYTLLQFTKTAGLLAAVGLLIITDAIIFRKNILSFLAGSLLFALAVLFRFEMVIFAVGYAGLLLLFWFFENIRKLIPDGYFKPGRIMCYVISVLILAGSCGLFYVSEAKNNSTKELKDYHEYNYYRYSYVDYSVYDDYKKDPERYESTGLAADDFFLIRKWYFDYDGAASKENLSKIKEVYDSTSTGESRTPVKTLKKTVKQVASKMKDRTVIGCHIILLILIALYAMIKGRRRSILYVLAVGVSTFTLYFMLNYMGRSIYRVLFIIDLAATLWLLYSALWRDSCAGADDESADEEDGRPVIVKGALVILMVLVIAAAGLGSLAAYRKSIEKHNSIKVMSADMEELVSQDKDHVYVFSTLDKRYDKDYLTPLKAPELHENVFTFGSWGTKSPYLNDRMKAYGLNNVFRDIIDNDKVYVIDNHNAEKMEKYLDRWYGESLGGKKVRYEKVDDISGSKFWRVVTE